MELLRAYVQLRIISTILKFIIKDVVWCMVSIDRLVAVYIICYYIMLKSVFLKYNYVVVLE